MSLFGGSQETTTTGWKPAMKEFKQSVLPTVQEWGSLYGQGQDIYTGTRLAEEDPLVGMGQDEALMLASLFGNQYAGLTDTLEGFLDYDPNSVQNQASRDALSANINAIFNESIRPGIEDRGTFAGQFGGPQSSIAMGAATAPLSRAIADAEVGLMNADRNRAMQALGLAPSIYSQQFLPAEIMQSIGMQRTGREQMELEDEIQMSEAERNALTRSIQEQTGLLMPLANLAQTTSTSTSQSPLSVAAGLGALYLGAGAPGLGSLFGGGVPSMVPSTGVPGLNYAVPFSGGVNL